MFKVYYRASIIHTNWKVVEISKENVTKRKYLVISNQLVNKITDTYAACSMAIQKKLTSIWFCKLWFDSTVFLLA